MAAMVCCLDDEGALAAHLRILDIPVVVVKRKRGSDPLLFARLARVLRSHHIDVVHTHGPDPMFYGGWAALLAGIAVRIHTQHDTMLAQGTWRDRLKFRLALPPFHNVVAVSAKTHEIVTAFDRRGLRTVTIRNGVNVRRFSDGGISPAPSRGTMPEAGLTIGTVARLAPEKGLDRLI
jgi:glycosyltransferase involved in cell wall biosynthesis